MSVLARPSRVLAVLGPTNTGKTHFAIERLMGHATGMIGFPLRLLARENYDRIVAARGRESVALITGEERILPSRPRWFVCTVEAMPVDRPVEFVAIDEIQLAADPERGHVFTDRLLNARGLSETLVLGSETARPMLRRLLPDLEVITRPRLSKLTYTGPKKLTRLPRRSAVVAFSAQDVYQMAELLRRQRGGCAVVMGALSPRARNAQVGLFQSGEVDYLVATDAIGMGLNMDLDHVAFARMSKFDGRGPRRLTPSEMAQIAGRAGRYHRDGTFGPTAEIGAFDPDLIEAIESHQFESLRQFWWRNSDLDLRSVAGLLTSLDRPPPMRDLARKRDAEDHRALQALARLPEVTARAVGRAQVRLLWDVCSIPDFTKLLGDGHVRLLATIYDHLSAPQGRLPADWVERQIARLDRTDGDIDALSARLAHVRTWTYVAQRADWLTEAGFWQERARALEDRLSDALHARLTERFVDRRGAFLIQRLADPDATLLAGVRADGDVVVEGHPVGKLRGFRFEPDPAVVGLDARRLMTAARRALSDEIARRVDRLVAASDDAVALAADGSLAWEGTVVARLAPGPAPLTPAIEVLSADLLTPAAAERVRRRLAGWMEDRIATDLNALGALQALHLGGVARGLVYRLTEGLGIAVGELESAPALPSDDRLRLSSAGVRIGRETVWLKAMLTGSAARLRLMLIDLHAGRDLAAPPNDLGRRRVRPISAEAARVYADAGYRLAGPIAFRVDAAELFADLVRRVAKRAGGAPFAAQPLLAEAADCGLAELPAVLEAFGWRGRAVEGGWQFRAKPRRAIATRVAPLAEESPFAALAALRTAIG